MKFTERVRNTVADYTAKIRAKDEQISDHQRNGIEMYSDAKYKEMLLELNEQHNLLMVEAVNAVKAIIEEYKAALPARFAANGSELDVGDMQLMGSGYKLTQADMEAMFDRHPGNNTMLRSVMAYCEEHEIHIDRVYNGEAAKASAADALLGYARSSFQRPTFGMETPEYFAQIHPEALKDE